MPEPTDKDATEILDPPGAGAAGPTREPGFLAGLGLALSWAALVVVALVAIVAIIVPRATGSTPLAILTGSMDPTYPPGTLVVVKPLDPTEVKVGDVITYQLESGKPTLVTHRVVELGLRADGERQWVTQGDANDAPDELPVRAVQLRGRVWYHLPYVGHVTVALGNGGRGTIVALVAGAFIAYGVWQITSGLLGRGRRKDAASPAAEPAPAPDAPVS